MSADLLDSYEDTMPEPCARFMAMIDEVLDPDFPADIVAVFDGRSRSCRQYIEQDLES